MLEYANIIELGIPKVQYKKFLETVDETNERIENLKIAQNAGQSRSPFILKAAFNRAFYE